MLELASYAGYLPNLLVFVLVLGVLMFVHELGHFVTARRSGIVVEEFGFGLPPRMFGVERGGVMYSLNWIPFGAFVKMLGEEDPNAPGSFASKSKLTQIIVLAAGSGMNYLTAGLAFAAAYMTGFPTPVNVAIMSVSPGSPADVAGLRVDDIVDRFGGRQITTVDEFRQLALGAVGKPIELTVRRGQDALTVSVTPRENPPAGQGAVGVALRPGEVRPVRYNPIEAVGLGFWRATQVIELTITAPLMVLQGMASADMLRPVGLPGMAQATSQAVDAVVSSGYLYPVLMMAGTFSAGLAFANMLPIPALDGGRIFFIVIEMIRGRAISPERQSLVHYVGIVVLIALMVLVSVNDLRNPLPSIDWGVK
ncbi:MAG: M50 family metallopeptidase [Chloroflexota bacterium]